MIISPVFLTQTQFPDFSQRPSDSDRGIVPRDTTLFLGVVQLVALVDELGLFTQHQESMGEALGDEKLLPVLIAERHAYIPTPCRASPAEINRHVVHLALDDPYQLRLLMDLLKMQPPQHTLAALALVVLHELA